MKQARLSIQTNHMLECPFLDLDGDVVLLSVECVRVAAEEPIAGPIVSFEFFNSVDA